MPSLGSRARRRRRPIEVGNDERRRDAPPRVPAEVEALRVAVVVRLPSTKPATPNSEICASETMPPYAERKMRLAATMPEDEHLGEQLVDPVLGEDQWREQRERRRRRRRRCDRRISAPEELMRAAEEPERTHGEHDRQQDEREDDRVVGVVGRQVGGREVRRQPEQQRSDRGAAQRAHPADDHDDERVEQPVGVDARREARERAADDPAEPGSAEPTTNAMGERRWMLIPIAETMSRSSTPARMTIPCASLQPEPERAADGEAEAQDDQARHRVLDAVDVEIDELVECSAATRCPRRRRRSGRASGRRG